MTKKVRVTLAVVGLFAGMAGAFLREAEQVAWLGLVLLLVAQPLWMAVFGEARTDCQVVDQQVVRGDRAATHELATVRCGDRHAEYKPYQTASEYIGDVGERTSLVFGRTGLMDPVRPSGVTTTGASALPGVALLELLSIAFCATRPPISGRKPKVEQEVL